jgi:predicted DNA-binding transcriptional regulator AlpA
MSDINQAPRFTNLIEVSRQTSLGKSTVLAWEAQGKFPKAVRLSPTKRVWLQSDISNWMLEKCKHT